MALFKISKGLAKNLMANVPYAKEGFAYFTTDDGKLYIDIAGDGTSIQAKKGTNRICLNSDYADRLKINSNATKAKDNQVARFNGNDGSLQGSDVTIDDEGTLVATKIYATDIRVNETTGKTEIADVDVEKYDFGVVGASYFQGNVDIKGNITLNGEIGGTRITKGNNSDILGTTKNNTVFSNQLTLKQGAVFGGSAQEAGLVTRGICGISTPTGDGSCNKDNLYINYDGDNSYKTNRQVILQAGAAGENYGNNLYQYAAARGDAVHDWALNNFYVKSNIDKKFQTWLELSDALIYQGTIAGGKSSPGNFTFAANRGDVYKVSVAGYINGQPVEVGDLFICNTDTTKPASSSNYTTIQANWDIINTNVDGAAFIGTGKTLTDKSLVIANGTKGQLKSSGAVGSATQPFYINNSGVPTAISYTANRLYYPSSTINFTAGNHYISNNKIQINGTSVPGYNLQVAGTTNLAGETTSQSITPANNNVYNLGTAEKQWKNIYGKLIGASYEAYLQWGGKNLEGHYSPIDANLNGRLGANRLAGIKPAGVTIEYSNNGGSTWTNYELTNEEKIAIFTTLTCPKSLRIAGPTAAASANSKLRITLDGVDGGVYTQLNKLHIYVSTSYSNNCTVSLESYDYNSSTEWHSVIKDQPITGWTGWNVLNFTLPGSTAFGGTNQNIHQRKIRLTFSNASITIGKEKEGLQIYNIYGYGGMGWTTPSVLASGGVPYTYDSNLMVSFPSYVKSSLFVGDVKGDVTGNITGNAATASKWKNARTFKIGNCSRTVDGSSDITWPLNEIGVASHNHDSSYVKKSGDTMTGDLKFQKTNSDGTTSTTATIGAATGYITGTWLQTTSVGNKVGDFATIDSSGWIYKRTAAQARQDMGLSTAMHFIGKATVDITDGSTVDPKITGYTTKTAGDVIIDKNNSYEYVWTLENKWERLGPDGSYSVIGHNHDDVYVKKSGDTMTGLLKTNGSIENQGEAKFTHPDYCPDIEDTAENIGCAFKASRGHFNQMNVNEIYLPATTTTSYTGNKISFKSYSGGNNGAYANVSEVASINKQGFTIPGTDTADRYFRATNSNGSIGLLTSTNQGLYDYTNSKWILYHNKSNGINYFNGLATKATQDKNGLQIDTNYLKLSGGTMSGKITFKFTTSKPARGARLPVLSGQYQNGSGAYYSTDLVDMIGTGSTSTANAAVRFGSTNGATFITSGEGGHVFPSKLASNLVDCEHINFCSDGGFHFWGNIANDGSSYTSYMAMSSSKIQAYQPLYGAVWNDYAEFREGDTIEPGKCVIEVGDDTLITSTERMMPGANITSDTFGFAIGETEQAKTPIAVSGRVLAYPYESREEFKKNIGRPVCSGPNGTVSIMTDEEYRNKGYCAIGTISAVPDYEEWGTGKVKVNGRVWIKVF